MLKLLPLLVKAAPIVWAFIKEVVLKKEDKRYFIRNKFQVFVTLLIMLYTLALYILYEGYNAHANASLKKTGEIQELFLVLDRKIEENTALRRKYCPATLDTYALQDMADRKTLDKIIDNNDIGPDQKTQQ
jgi:hypothetical protein